MTIPGIRVGHRLWKRCARIKLNGTTVAEHGPEGHGHRIVFRVSRHNRVEPNDADVQIYGLSKEKRQRLTTAFETARTRVINAGGYGSIGDLSIEAGYDGVMGQLCLMDIVDITHEDLAPGWCTTIIGRDGVLPYGNTVVNESFGPGVPLNLVLQTLATSMGVALDSPDYHVALAQFTRKQVRNGFVLQGPAREKLTEICEALALSWSIQDGKLVLTRFDQVSRDQAVLLTPAHGLTKRLQVRDFGRALAESRLNYLLSPMRQVQVLDSKGKPQGAGWYRIDQVDHSGDTDVGAWTSRLVLGASTLLPSGA